MDQLITAGLVIIRDRKLLLAFSKNKKAWYLPGGKVADGESTKEALVREIHEEMEVTLKTEALLFYTHITAPAFGEDPAMIMKQDCFLYEFVETPKANAEISALKFFDQNSYKAEIQVPGVVLLMKKLIAEDLMD